MNIVQFFHASFSVTERIARTYKAVRQNNLEKGFETGASHYSRFFSFCWPRVPWLVYLTRRFPLCTNTFVCPVYIYTYKNTIAISGRDRLPRVCIFIFCIDPFESISVGLVRNGDGIFIPRCFPAIFFGRHDLTCLQKTCHRINYEKSHNLRYFCTIEAARCTFFTWRLCEGVEFDLNTCYITKRLKKNTKK